MPTSDASVAPIPVFAAPGWTKPFSAIARTLKGWNFLLVPILVTLSIIGVGATSSFAYEICEGDRFIDDERTLRCLNKNAFMLSFTEGIAGVLILTTFLVLGAGFAWTGHRKRCRQLRRGYETRIQNIRDHVITGSVSPDTFDQIQTLWKPLARGSHPAVRARAGTATAIVFNVFNSLLFGVALTTFVIGSLAMSMEEDPDQTEAEIFQVMWNSILIPIMLISGIVMIWGWVVFPRAHSAAVHAVDEAVDSAERLEIRVVAGEQAPRRSRTAVATGGPSYSPYSGRAGPG